MESINKTQKKNRLRYVIQRKGLSVFKQIVDISNVLEFQYTTIYHKYNQVNRLNTIIQSTIHNNEWTIFSININTNGILTGIHYNINEDPDFWTGS